MYRYNLFHYLIIAILIVIQPFISEWFMISNVKIDFLLIFLIIISFNKEKKDSFILILVTGLIYGLLYSNFFFQYVIVLLIALLSVWGISKIAKIESVLYITIYGALILFATSFIKAFLELPLKEIGTNITYITRIALYNGIYGGIIFMIVSVAFLIVSLFSVNRVQTNRGHF